MRVSCPISALFTVLIACPAYSQPYPNRPLRLIIPMAAGGATDIVIRTITPRMSELLGQQIIVDNRPGANGVMGDEMVVKAAPDGYTLHANSLAIAINPSLYKLTYDIRRDLTPVTQLASVDLILGVYPQLPVKSVRDLIALAKSQPNKLNYASFGIGSIAHIAGEMFKQATQTQIVHVAYKASPLAVQETIAGQTQFVFGGVSYMLPQVRAGRLNGIGVASLKRTPLAPEIPTLDESGVPGFESTAWFGMWMPPQTPKTIVNRIHDVVVKSLNDSRPAIEKLGYKIGGETPGDFAQFVRAEVEKYARVVKAAGIKPEG
ncbi:MAG TPA: tripartite tricarboxylate transporter substrate binding protein [Burkholderiales bacterium]|jgi:tripartite-type tricarboxylate transporter receptor subunit TctC|nr:tripartite tricarboxylate transporter substrate binding protein [Burkholderiales bacterium]